MSWSQNLCVDPEVCFGTANARKMIGRRGRCELGDTLSRLSLYRIDGKKMWGEKWVMRGEVGVMIAPDRIFIFCLHDDQRGRIEQEVAEQTERLVDSPLFSRFPPVSLFLLAANVPSMNVRGQRLR